jgi:hypothetical protein
MIQWFWRRAAVSEGGDRRGVLDALPGPEDGGSPGVSAEGGGAGAQGRGGDGLAPAVVQ